ncbi:MAG: virulence RhuM family protein [Methylobacter sp.]|nr:virulence RhuM family protein [Methylobacter sp.]
MTEPQNPIVIFQTEDGCSQVVVNVIEETVWLSQAQMCALFDKNKRTVSEHIRNIFKEGELQEQAVVRNFRTTAADGKSYEVYHYNLDVIISVGYRVKSRRGTQFRIWANNILKQYLIQGYALNEQKLQAQQEKFADLKLAIALGFWNVTSICITRKAKNGLPIMHSWRLPC